MTTTRCWRVSARGCDSRATRYLFVEGSPRVAGFDLRRQPDQLRLRAALRRSLFQLNFSNGFDTTLAQVARGGTGNEDWYLGFNLIRKFF